CSSRAGGSVILMGPARSAPRRRAAGGAARNGAARHGPSANAWQRRTRCANAADVANGTNRASGAMPTWWKRRAPATPTRSARWCAATRPAPARSRHRSWATMREAEDAAQDAFVRALRNLDLLADPAKFAPWLRRIAFGVAVDRLRSRRAELLLSG